MVINIFFDHMTYFAPDFVHFVRNVAFAKTSHRKDTAFGLRSHRGNGFRSNVQRARRHTCTLLYETLLIQATTSQIVGSVAFLARKAGKFSFGLLRARAPIPSALFYRQNADDKIYVCKLKKKFRPRFFILKFHRLEGKQRRS